MIYMLTRPLECATKYETPGHNPLPSLCDPFACQVAFIAGVADANGYGWAITKVSGATSS
jgi:hypothetical protein